MSKADFENLTTETRAGAAWITINRPDKLNALNRQTVEEIGRAVDQALADAKVVALVITGSGEKAFVAGADIPEMASLSPREGQLWGRFLQASLDRLERAAKPVIAAVNGYALGGGCELAMACHVRLASDNATFGQPEVNLGLIPGAGGTQRLPRLVGRGRALDLILSGASIDAAEAHRIGLVNRVVAQAELADAVTAYVKNLSRKSPIALARCIESVVAGGEMAQDDAMRYEASLFGLSFATEDMREGTRAFVEKRKPEFRGN